MDIERDKNQYEEDFVTSAEVDLRDYLKDAKPGDPKFMALYDCINEDIIEGWIQGYLNSLSNGGSLNGGTLRNIESRLRINEQILVGIKLRIQDRISAVPAYGAHLRKINDSLDEITDQYYEKYPVDSGGTPGLDYAELQLERIYNSLANNPFHLE